MKKLFLLFTVIGTLAACSSNPNTEAQEQASRDSIDEIQKDANQRFVDSLEQADRMREMHDHDHEHDHGDHVHGAGDTAHHEH